MKSLPRFLTTVSWTLLGLGIGLRLLVYAQNRSLIIDEANLALNIVERQGWAFFQSLDYQQYCPPLFLLASKWSTLLGGVNEWSLKALPLLSGLVLLILLYRLAKHWLNDGPALWYMLGLAALSPLLIRYSTEVKQYSTDGAITLGLILLALQMPYKNWTAKTHLGWGLLGAFCIWASMPSIFILATLGLTWLVQHLQKKRTIPWGLLGIGVFWLVHFGLYFKAILVQDAASSHLQAYHQAHFFNLLPWSKAALWLDYRLLVGTMTSVTDHTVLGLGFGFLLYGIGAVVLIRRSKIEAAWLLGPVLLCFFTSHFKLYSLIPRLTIFFLPLMLVVIGIGFQTLWQNSHKSLQVVLVVLALLGWTNKKGYVHLWQPLEIEDSKSILAYLSQHHQGEPIFVQADGVPAFRFYNTYHDQAYHFAPVHLAQWDEPISLTTLAHPSRRFWLFFSHTFPEKKAAYLQEAQTLATPRQAHAAQTASVHLFDYAPQ